MQAFLLCGWLTGLRLNEPLALEREETDRAPSLDPARDPIIFPAELVKADEERWVPLSPKLWEAVDVLPRAEGAATPHEARKQHHDTTGPPRADLPVTCWGRASARSSRRSS